MLVLDTNILIELVSHNPSIIKELQKILEKYPSMPYITSPSYSEFLYGYIKKDSKNQEKAKEFLEQFTLLHTTKASSRILAELKHELESKGKTIPIFDMLIASIVLDKKASFITLDEHFRNIPELKVMILNKQPSG